VIPKHVAPIEGCICIY